MSTSFYIACIVSVFAPWLFLFSCRYSFSEGTLFAKEEDWLSSWKTLGIIAMLFTVGAFLLETIVYGADVLTGLRWALAINLVLVSAWADAKQRIIPNGQVLWAVLAALVIIIIQILVSPDDWRHILGSPFLGASIGAGVFFISRIVTRGGVGYGDIKLFGALGMLIGLDGVLSVLFYSIAAAFIVAIVMLVTKKKKMADRMPLGPFVLFGVVLAVVFGV